MAELNKKALVAEIRDALKRNRTFHQGMVKQLDEALKQSANIEAYRFSVKLDSVQEGKSATTYGNKDLEQAFRHVIKRFMKINNCNHVQAWWREITIKLPCGHVQHLPQKMWLPVAVKVLEDLDPKLAEEWRKRL